MPIDHSSSFSYTTVSGSERTQMEEYKKLVPSVANTSGTFIFDEKTSVTPVSNTSMTFVFNDKTSLPPIPTQLVSRFERQNLQSIEEGEGKRKISDKVIENSRMVVKFLSFYLPNASDHQVYFEEDDDNSILIFIEIYPHSIMINVYEDRLEYSYANEKYDHSLEVSRIPFREDRVTSAMNSLLEKPNRLWQSPIHTKSHLLRIASTDSTEWSLLSRRNK